MADRMGGGGGHHRPEVGREAPGAGEALLVAWYYQLDNGCTSPASLRNLKIEDSSEDVYYDQYHPIHDNQVVGISGCGSSCGGPPTEQLDLSNGQFEVQGSGYVDHYVITSGPGSSAGNGPSNAGMPNFNPCHAGDPVTCATGNCTALGLMEAPSL